MTMLAVLMAVICAGDYVPPPVPCASDLVVGSYYFPGHFNPLRWRPFKRCGYPIPVLGFYRDGEPEVSDWHIKWAVEHGLSFFAFDLYYHWRGGPSLDHNQALDRGFLRARYRDLMKFTLMWCNEENDAARYTEDDMLRLAGYLTEHYFSRPNFLRVGGDNVLIVSVPERMIAAFGVEGTARIFEKMAAVSRKAGCGGLYPVAKQDAGQDALKAAGFRACTVYNYPTAGMSAEELKANRAPYESMVRGFEEIWQRASKGALPYIVPVSPGWDSTPWYGAAALVRTNPRPGLYYDMCLRARRYVNPDLKMVIAECWNEFGEGSYLEPTLQFGFGWLDAMRDAFCPDNPHHADATPQGIGRPAPTFTPDEVPSLTAEEMLAAGGNMLYNGDMAGRWGWVLFDGQPVTPTADGHGGRRALRVPAGHGVKTQWLMPVPPSRRVKVDLWARVPAGAEMSVTLALFRSNQWLGRYAPVTKIAGTGGQWKRVQAVARVDDPEAGQIDIEFVAAGGDCQVAEVSVRP
jgi:hypothetical protein